MERWEDGIGEETIAEKGHRFQRRWLKKSDFFQEKKGDTHQLPPRVTPTLVTPLIMSSLATDSAVYVEIFV